MTFRGHGTIFRRARGFSPACLALACAALLSACASATIEDAVPQNAASAPAAGTTASALPAGPIDTGAYPNLNIAPVAATSQLTAAQRAAKTAELTRARAQNAGLADDSVSSDEAPLRRLAQTHADEALKQIEAEQ